jgi:hypothetical protein
MGFNSGLKGLSRKSGSHVGELGYNCTHFDLFTKGGA